MHGVRFGRLGKLPGRPLPYAFSARPTLEVARGLLGQLLVRRVGSALLVARIVETEAYIGEDDPACHAACGRTARNAIMYGPSGRAYVYFTYGMHFCLNVVTGREGFPAAVLLRAAEPLEGLGWMRARRGVEDVRLLLSGPARLAQGFGLGRAHNGADLKHGALRLVRGEAPREAVVCSPRVGIRKAVERPWRFFLEGCPFVSKGPRRSRPAPGPGR